MKKKQRQTMSLKTGRIPIQRFFDSIIQLNRDRYAFEKK